MENGKLVDYWCSSNQKVVIGAAITSSTNLLKCGPSVFRIGFAAVNGVYISISANTGLIEYSLPAIADIFYCDAL